MDVFIQLGAVVLGWALGVASAAGTTFLERRRGRRAMKRAIAQEFREVKARMVATVFLVEPLTRELVHWTQANGDDYDGPNPTPAARTALPDLLKASDAQLAEAAGRRERERDGTAYFHPRVEAPYAASIVTQVHEFEPAYAVNVLDILAQMQIFNDVRESVLYFHQQTFSSDITKNNHERLTRNVEQGQHRLAQRAKIIVERIHALTQPVKNSD